MGSVYVRWNGRCGNAGVRDSLIERIGELAELSHAQFAAPPGVRHFNNTIGGEVAVEILVDPGLLDASAFEEPATSALGGRSLRVAGPLEIEKPQHPPVFLRVSRVRLEGLEFRLFDGRALYPGEDRMSFVFAFFDEYPALDGLLVYVEDGTQCKQYRNQEVQQADFYLTSPTIHLRRYCETWMDGFLSWIRRFYIPELTWWRHETLSGYETWKAIDPGNVEIRDATFAMLKDTFRDEVAKWSDAAALAREFWDKAGRSGSSVSSL